MSTKKNLIFKTFLETSPLVQAIILDQVIQFEESQCQKELEDLRELIRQKEEAIALAALAASQQNLEDQEATEIAAYSETESFTPSSDLDVNTTKYTVEKVIDFEEALRNPLLDMVLPSEESIIEKYKVKINSLYQTDLKQLKNSYKFLFEKFNYTGKMQELLTETSMGDELFTEKYLLGRGGSYSLYHCDYHSLSGQALRDPLWLLFILRLTPASVKIFHKLCKLRVRKWKLKKRKLRKIRSLRKIRRIAFFKKTKRKFFLRKWNTSYFYTLKPKQLTKTIVRRIPLSDRVIDTSNVEFFYKLNKDLGLEFEDYTNLSFDLIEEDDDDDFLLYLRNYHQKPYWKLRNSRISHWRLFYNKTIRQQRYKGFISRYVKNYHKLSYSYTYLVNSFTQFNLSWSRTDKLESILKKSLIELTGQKIIKLPIFFQNIFKWKVLKRNNFYLRKKVGKWSFLNFRRATCPWLQRKKNSPKTALHIQPQLFYLNANSHWDSMTGYLFLPQKLPKHVLPVRDEFKTNLLIKLHMYRYKSNN